MGEGNTCYFHLSTIIKRRKAKVSMLKDDSNTWIDDPNMIKEMVQNHFKELFRNQDNTPGTYFVINSHNNFSNENNENLCSPISN